MYIQEITLELTPDVDLELLVDEFNWLMSSYHKSGQVANGGYTQFVSGNKIIAMPYTHEKDSLDPRNNNSHVNKQIKRIESVCGHVPMYRTIGTTSDKGNETCTCKRPSSLFLTALSFSRDSALLCGDCKLPLPLYRIPKTDDDTYSSIINWQLNNQIADGVEIINMNNDVPSLATPFLSAVDKLGYMICSRIEDLTGIKTRLSLNVAKSKPVKKASKTRGSGHKLSSQ